MCNKFQLVVYIFIYLFFFIEDGLFYFLLIVVLILIFVACVWQMWVSSQTVAQETEF